jgi:hypothetical protein
VLGQRVTRAEAEGTVLYDQRRAGLRLPPLLTSLRVIKPLDGDKEEEER